MVAHVEKLRPYLLYSLVAYPFVDFALRELALPVLPGLWDEVVFTLLLLCLATRVLAGQPLRPSPVLKPMGVFLAVSIAVMLIDLRSLAIGVEGLRATFEYMVVFFFAANLVESRQEMKRYLYVASGLAAVGAAYGVYQYVIGAPMPEGWVEVQETIRTRAYSVIGSPNGLGDYMALMTPVTLGLAYDERGWWRRGLLLAATGLIGLALLLTFSRGAWLALAAAAGAIALTLDRRLLVALVLGAVVATVAVPPVTQRVGHIFSGEYLAKSMAYGGRLYRWNQAYEQMLHAPLSGAGVGQYGGAVAARRLGVPYTDNYYAKVAAESGLAGLAALLWLVYRSTRLGGEAARILRSGANRGMAAGLWGAVLVVIFHNAVENIFEIPFLNTYFWFTVGLLAVLPHLAGPGRPDPSAAAPIGAQSTPTGGRR